MVFLLSRKNTNFVSNPDGAQIWNQDFLYISEVLTAAIKVYDISGSGSAHCRIILPFVTFTINSCLSSDLLFLVVIFFCYYTWIDPLYVCGYTAPSNVVSIDDFSISDDGSLIYAADYRNGTGLHLYFMMAYIIIIHC